MNSGFIYVILCYALIGISYPIAKDAMNDIPIWIFTATTFFISLFVLFPLAKTIDKAKFSKISFGGWLAISVQSLLGAVLYTAFLLYGFTYSSAIAGSIFTSLAPAVVLVLSFLLLKEKLNVRKVSAILMAVIGVLVLTVPNSDAGGSTSVSGFAFLLLSTLSVAGCVIAAKRLDVKLPAITMATGVCLTGFIFSLPMAISESTSFDWSILTSSHYIVLVYYALLVWAAPYVFFYKGVTRIPASATGMAFSVIPIAATIFSVLFFGESLSLTGGIALALVTASILFAESKEEELIVFSESENAIAN